MFEIFLHSALSIFYLNNNENIGLMHGKSFFIEVLDEWTPYRDKKIILTEIKFRPPVICHLPSVVNFVNPYNWHFYLSWRLLLFRLRLFELTVGPFVQATPRTSSVG
jgi:hypothetical protein